MTSASPPPELVAALPKYQLTRMLGEGGFGCVYEARDPRLDRPVAIKHLPAMATGETAMGTGSILVVLCALAYLESIRRSIVAGHLRRAGTTVAAVVGLPLGVGLWMAAAVFTVHEPVLGAGIVCALSGAVLAAAGTTLSVRLARGPSRH